MTTILNEGDNSCGWFTIFGFLHDWQEIEHHNATGLPLDRVDTIKEKCQRCGRIREYVVGFKGII